MRRKKLIIVMNLHLQTKFLVYCIVAKYMVYMTSIIAFGHEKYMNSGERGTDGPQLLEQADGSYILTYDVAPRRSSVVGTHCTLSLQPNTIEFKAEEKTME